MNGWTKNSVARVLKLSIVAFLVLAQSAAAGSELQDAAQDPESSSVVLGPSSTVFSYQGQLLEASGDPVDGDTDMVFSLYHQADDGTAFWTESHSGGQAVAVTEGLFHVMLGRLSAIDPADLTGDVYLEVTVNGEALEPRELFASVVYAVEASTLQAGATTRGGLNVNGYLNLQAHSLDKAKAVRLTDWDDGTGGTDDKYRLLARDGAWQFYNGGVAVGSYSNGTWGDLADGTLIVEGKVGVGTTSTSHGQVQIQTNAVPLAFKENGQSGAGSLWRMPLDAKYLRFDASQNGTNFDGYKTALALYANGSISCGAITEANLLTPEERASGGIDRFEEGDVLCWGVDQLELCSTTSDSRVQAVADQSGRPIVLGAEVIKVIGPVHAGDYLVSSGVPGYAMASAEPTFGVVIAQALEDLEGERGLVKAMIRKM